jgi:5,10-methenyltetrahydromethanopterin hydrogenase
MEDGYIPTTSSPEALLGEGLLTFEEISIKIESDDDAAVYDFATSSPEALLGEGLLTCEEISVKIESDDDAAVYDDDAVVYDFPDPAGSPSQAVTSPVSLFS